MAFQLDDLLRDDKREANLIADLSKATCNSQEEFRRLRERCPEYKINKPEKVRKDDVKIRDKDFSWRTTKKELKAMQREWSYGDPIPPDMRSLDLQELQRVAIDWRMLTSLRPKVRADEEMFSRLVEMGKLQLKTLAKERRISISPIRRFKNRTGIIESSVKICGECGEEYCFGDSCGDILYDSFVRINVPPQQQKIKVSEDTAAIIAGMNKGKGKKKMKKSKKKGGSRKVKMSLSARKSAKLARKKKNEKKNNNHNSKATSLNEMKNHNNDDDNNEEIKMKKFKRKCSKYGKKNKIFIC